MVECFEKSEHVGLTLCYLSKAFDCDSHKLILEKLFRYGVRDSPLNLLLRSLLDNRQHCVEVNDWKSCFETVRCVLHLGSVLGSQLFLIYINDLYYNIIPIKCTLRERHLIYCPQQKHCFLNNSLIALYSVALFENNSRKLNLDNTKFNFYYQSSNGR